MHSRDVVDKIYEVAVSVRQHTVFQQAFLKINRKNTLKNNNEGIIYPYVIYIRNI